MIRLLLVSMLILTSLFQSNKDNGNDKPIPLNPQSQQKIIDQLKVIEFKQMQVRAAQAEESGAEKDLLLLENSILEDAGKNSKEWMITRQGDTLVINKTPIQEKK